MKRKRQAVSLDFLESAKPEREAGQSSRPTINRGENDGEAEVDDRSLLQLKRAHARAVSTPSHDEHRQSQARRLKKCNWEISPELHLEVRRYALDKGTTLRAILPQALRSFMEANPVGGGDA